MVVMLPQTEVRALRWCIVLMCSGCAYLAYGYVTRAIAGSYGFALIAPGMVGLAAGLWRLRPEAREIAKALMWVFVFVLPLGTINPFAAMDELGPNPPDVWYLVFVLVLPRVLVLLGCIHVLDRYKSEFKFGPRGMAPN